MGTILLLTMTCSGPPQAPRPPQAPPVREVRLTATGVTVVSPPVYLPPPAYFPPPVFVQPRFQPWPPPAFGGFRGGVVCVGSR